MRSVHFGVFVSTLVDHIEVEEFVKILYVDSHLSVHAGANYGSYNDEHKKDAAMHNQHYFQISEVFFLKIKINRNTFKYSNTA